MKKIALLGAALAALAATGASAQGQSHANHNPQLRQPLTRAAVQTQVQARFVRLDANRDGFLTQAEVQAQRQAVRGERREARGQRRGEIFARLDANRDGELSREEFQNRRQGAQQGDRAERREARQERRSERRGLRAQRGGQRGGGLFARHFLKADANNDGRVSLAEAKSGALQLFDRIDANRDGSVSADERRAARQSMGGPRRQGRRG